MTVDDAAQGVTLVTRGHDLFAASHVHRLLQALLDLPVPEYHHHRLITDSAGRRFAKRDQAVTLAALRAPVTGPRIFARWSVCDGLAALAGRPEPAADHRVEIGAGAFLGRFGGRSDIDEADDVGLRAMA